MRMVLQDRGNKKPKWLNSRSNEGNKSYYKAIISQPQDLKRRKRKHINGLLQKSKNNSKKADNTIDFYHTISQYKKYPNSKYIWH